MSAPDQQEMSSEPAPDFSRGPVPAVAQDAETGEVLMVAYLSPEAWARTRETGHAWFQSRTRGLWEKGATSGNYLDVVEVRLDCDADTVLLKVHPHGPACHTGERSCFFTVVSGKPAAGGPR